MAAVNVRRMPVELRAAPDLGDGFVSGYVTDYGAEYRVGWQTKERIDAHAFDESIKDRAFPVFYEHDWSAGPIGHQTFASDKRGLLTTAELYIDDDPRARSVFKSLKAGALREWSIGFLPSVIERSVNEDDGTELEVIKSGDLLEASVVVKGANPDTATLEVRTEVKLDSRPAVPEFLVARMSEPHVRSIIRNLLAL